jgi:hypothetical protein
VRPVRPVRPPSRPLAGAAGALVASALLAPGFAHVAPSERENNRYILLAPLGDRVRMVYTVYIGQQPGRAARARMDADRDGRLDEREAQAYGDAMAAQVAPRLSLEVDGRPVAIDWQEVDVGLGQPTVAAGAFAVDLVAWICLPSPRERLTHRVHLRDGFHLPTPGENELRAEESPGVRIVRTQLGSGRTDTVRLMYRWMGDPGAAETHGYWLEFAVDPALATFGGDGCDGSSDAPGDRGARQGAPIAMIAALGGLALAALALVALLALFARRRSRRDPPTPSSQKMNG